MKKCCQTENNLGTYAGVDGPVTYCKRCGCTWVAKKGKGA